MSGHNKWSTIKHKKSAADAKKGKLFTRLAKEIIVAARDGSDDLTANPRLRAAVDAAKNVNMPNANIEKAIKRGTGELEGSYYEEYTYEGYGPGGVAILVEVMTDNKNRTVAEVRHLFTKYDGSLAETGAVSWIFEQKGYILLDPPSMNEDEAIMVAIEAGAEDANLISIDEVDQDVLEIQSKEGGGGEVNEGSRLLEIYTAVQDFHKVQDYLESNDYPIIKSELTRIPKNVIKVNDGSDKLMKLLDKLEDLDDIQKVFANIE